MTIYAIDKNLIDPVPATSFVAEGWSERTDVQAILKNNIGCLDDSLLVIAEEFSQWSDSARRIDLLCIDQTAKLVVVEIKRTDDGGHMELQALRYAAMVSNMTFAMAVESLARHRNGAAPDREMAERDILGHLSLSAPDEGEFGKEVRIVLVAANFNREITTTALWLRNYKLDIRCIRFQPYKLADGRLLVDVQPLIPLPETAEFQTTLANKSVAERQQTDSGRLALVRQFLTQLQQAALAETPWTAGRAIDAAVGVLPGAAGKTGFTLNYVVKRNTARVELLVQRPDGQARVRHMMERRQQIEQAFGAPLNWDLPEGRTQCRVAFEVTGGYLSSEAQWPSVHDQLIDAMKRLEGVFRPRVQNIP